MANVCSMWAMGIWRFITLFLLLFKILHTKKKSTATIKEFNLDKLPNGIVNDSKRKYAKEQIRITPQEQISLAIIWNQ